MANDKSKASLLSAQLDFEDVGKPSGKSESLDFFDLDFDVDSRPDMLEEHLPSPPLPDQINPIITEQQFSVSGSAAQVASVKEQAIPELLKPKKSAFDTKSLKKTNNSKKKNGNDNFAFYAAIFALCGFFVVFVAIFYVKVIANESDTPTYLTLPETVVNIEENVIRIKVTIQVERKDRDWLNNNKMMLMQLLPIAVIKIDPDDLHSEEGFDLVREKLRVELNKEMKTDKIQSVLLDQLLMKTRD
ncbi:flagellar basal body-associated FliL family protein [Undibacterium sp. SXout11W]|uniref:flagellar basal body-associated FliL family protein n=1 Tax=Undibacterium sp. SXout11W TaxID=3413050 RepID=UPI003BF30678